MKTFRNIIIIISAVSSLISCADLDLQQKGVIDENVLFNSDYGVQKFFTGLYNDLPIEDFNYGACGNPEDGIGYSTYNGRGYHVGNIWQGQKHSAAMVSAEGFSRGYWNISGAFSYWPYERIRDLNNFLEKFPAYQNNFTEEQYLSYMAEARFLRGFYYFGMVKRYGGVPIIDKVQDPTADIASLQVSRNTEYDCWKFIYEDLKYAMEHLSSDRMQVYRANRYAAAALMSKAMLYAGSVAKYNKYVGITGQATEKGYMGMPESTAKEFFRYAYEACRFIYDGGYSLHKGTDKVKAYKEVFIEDCSGTEDIFVKLYDPKQNNADYKMGLSHGWDDIVLPLGEGLAQTTGTKLHAVWDMLKLYEIPSIIDENGNPVRFDRLEDFWDNENMEARCKANFLFSGMTEEASGTVIDMLAGIYTSFPGLASDAISDPNVDTDYTLKYRYRSEKPGTTAKIGALADGTIVLDYNDSDEAVVKKYGTVKISGIHGCPFNTTDEGYSRSGIFVNKYVNYNAAPATRVFFGSSQPWKVFRYGEILMNWAEAAYELGLETGDETLRKEAFEHVNEIRERAGATAYVMKDSPEDVGTALYGYPVDENLQYIRDERKRELCYENQSDWDQRRWRVSHSLYSNFITTMFYPYHILDEDKYIFITEVNALNDRRMTYYKRFYYEDIPAGEISKNPNLVHNDGY